MFGNGINRCFNAKSWSAIIAEISASTSLRLNNRFLNILSFDCQQIETNKISKKNLLSKVREDTKLSKEDLERCKNFYKNFTDLGCDCYLTTNYGYEIESSLGDFDETKIEEYCTNKRETVSSLKRANVVNGHKVYHIHGEHCFEDSICIGLQHYINNISHIDRRMQEAYGLLDEPEIRSTLRSALSHTWVKHMLFSNVHFVGFGLDQSEIDLWWLFALRASWISQGLLKENKIVYHYSEPKPCNALLKDYLNKMYVEVDETIVDAKDPDGYKKAYLKIANKIKKALDKE
ncbi:MAG: hypothetical protein Q4D13_08910 [Erysipelotrichaceae bacterium]|nr:hypothetical protein [Erysipelotrichaceae bacterium]